MNKSQATDLTGEKRGKLTVVSQAETKTKPNGNRVRMWNCVCSCGNKGQYETARLNQVKYVSCGCEMRSKFHQISKLK